MSAKEYIKEHKLLTTYLAIIALISAAVILYWFISWRYKVYTNDAYVEGNQVMITPLHEGFITSIHSDDTFLVEKGQLLVTLDDTDAKIALDAACDNLGHAVRSLCQTVHAVIAYRSEIEVKKAELIRAAQDFNHRASVVEAGGVSVEDFEHAVAALRTSYFSLMMTETLYDKTLAAVQGTTIRDNPIVRSACQRVKDAFVHLYRCKIYSPVEGLACQRKAQVGMWVAAGAPLLSVVPLDQIWVNANYKETQMKNIRLGQRVTLTSDLYGSDVTFSGKIIGLPGAAGNAYSILPPQNLSGNWIKIVQRLPVRVSLEAQELKAHPLRLGLSMEATTHTKDDHGPLLPATPEGSPLYATDIYRQEENGDASMIEDIIRANADPILTEYLQTPITEKSLADTSYNDLP